MSAQTVGLAVFGAGRIGAVHSANIERRIPGAELVGVADIDRTVAQRLVAEVGTGRIGDVESFLADAAVHGVIIATPTETHASLVMRVADAHKHVFCEKPISLRLAATQSAIDHAKRAGVLLQVGFQRRFDAEFSRARALVERGDIGDVRFLRLVGRDHTMPSRSYLRTSGGQYRDQMVHEFDMARWLMAPREVVEVFAAGSALVDPALSDFGDVDTSLAFLRFTDGALCVIDNAREAVYGYDVRAEIHGSKGMLLVGHNRLDGETVIDATYAKPEVASFIERFEDAYRHEMEAFAAAVRERREPQVGGQDALEALRIALAADRSAREHRPVRPAEVADD